MTLPDIDPDPLFDLLPQHIRRRDAESGGQLRALLAVIGEQVALVEDDIEQLYDDWFIDTCADWAVPYLGDLIGYRLLTGYTEALAAGGAARLLAARLAPRRDVAATVGARRRKGTLPLVENLAATVADWPARAVELRRLVTTTQPVRQYGGDAGAVRRRASSARGRYVDVRQGAVLDLVGSPFDELSHLAEAPRISAADDRDRRQGLFRPPAVGLYVWRLKPYSITRAPAYCVDRARNLFTFSILGNDTQLVAVPLPEPSPTHLATAQNVPVDIRRRAAADRLADFYGPGKSFTIWRDGPDREHPDDDIDDDIEEAGTDDGDVEGAAEQPGWGTPIPLSAIVVADLSDWRYRPRRHQVAVDPVLGRIAFGARHAPRRGVWVTYHSAFADDLGGGEYQRTRSTSPAAKVYRVGPGQEFTRITEAYERWRQDARDGDQPEAVIEITHSGAYQEQIELAVEPGQRLEVRAAEGTRPVLRLLDWYSNRPDALQIRGVRSRHHDDHDDDHDGAGPTGAPPRVVLDGLVITGRGVSVTGALGSVVLRHCTLVPGWSLEHHCEPNHPEEPSLVLENTSACVQIERSILGTILVLTDEVRAEPLPIHLTDSILDATATDLAAISAPDCEPAPVVLSVHRSTVIGEVHAHAVAMGENSIFDGTMRVARRGVGCLRFSYVPPGSRTPRRYHCEPDTALARGGGPLRPVFTSRRYGTAGYGQLVRSCPDDIARGAEDRSEMGVLHDLFQPQRLDNLRARLAEFSPAGTDAGIIFVS
jgi:hypothetical protein